MTARFDESREYYDKGRALLKSGDVAGAIVQFQLSIERHPHFKALELLGEALIQIGEPGRAIVPLAAATTLNVQVKAPSLLAEALLASGDRHQAHQIARLALERDGSNKKALAVFEATKAEFAAHNEG